jgi:hypothetical protein
VSSIINEQLLQRYARPSSTASGSRDINAPYSFQEWVSVFQGIIPGQEYKQYNDYLINWYKDKNNENNSDKNNLRLNYLTLLGQLQIFFADQETENWYTSIDLNNDKEILAAIPYFARKLRDISLYYLQLREKLKQAQVVYKQTGTRSGLIVQAVNNTLNKYTQNSKPGTITTLPASLWNSAPALTSINDSIGIEIQELYDTNSYFDRSNSVSNSAYFNQDSLASFLPILQSKGLITSSIDWIYDLGTFELSGTTGDDIVSYETFTKLSKEFSEKYISSEKYITNQALVSTQIDNFSINVLIGNNSFYWPAGAYKQTAENYKTYVPVPLSSTDLITLGTGGSSIDVSDTIFVKSKEGVKGAWLYKPPYHEQNATMLAFINAEAEQDFRFPFPGFGLSSENSLWSGYGLSSDPRFLYLKKQTQQEIYNKYWTQAFYVTGCEPIKLNNTTLTINKAWPSKTFSTADKIKTWTNPPIYTSTSFNDSEGIEENAWLYRFDNTDISINKESNTTILWPYQAILTEDPRPLYEDNLSNVCAPLSLSAINFTYALAGNGLSSADVLYKIPNTFGTTTQATECCWLSGKTINDATNKTLYVKQNAFQGLFTPGTFTHFIWTGPDYANVNDVFKTIQHRPDCKFITTPNTTYNDHKLCTCRQVNFTPFGHPGGTFNDFESQCDFIVEDTFFPGNFDITSWKDLNGAPYQQSASFFWYNTNVSVGFGYGSWVAGGTVKDTGCYLRTGERYFYYRANTRTGDTTEESNNYPAYAVRYDYGNLYTQNYNTDYVWIKAQQLPDGTWSSTDRVAEMQIFPGDLLLYSRRGKDTFSVTGTANTPILVRENRGSIWSSWDYVSVPEATDVVSVNRSLVSLNYPTAQQAATAPASQRPPYALNESVVNATWTITGPNGFTYRAVNTTSTFFTPLSPGIYSVSVRIVYSTTGLPVQYITNTASGTYFYANTAVAVFTGIPSITAIPATQNVPTLTSSSTTIPGYVLNTKLKGWDYSKSANSSIARDLDAGGKPFWAKAYNTKDSNTYYKGIDVWGQPHRFFDTYNVITQPEVTNIALSAGIKVRYQRAYNTNLEWHQPVKIQYANNNSQWHQLSFVTEAPSNLFDLLNNVKTDFVVTPTKIVSDIILENYIENEPVEIAYNALQNFTWNFSTQTVIPILKQGELSAIIALQPTTPWSNLPNINFPTVNFIPAFNNLKSKSEIGGFSTPNRLGASVYLDPEITNTFNVTSVFENLFDALGNRRGLSKQDQITPFLTTSNSIWLKEKTFSNSNAGTIDKKVFKKYQKFYPYQSEYETTNRTQIGMIDPSSRLSPWNGPDSTTWDDKSNYPVSYTGELNLQKWLDNQKLKQSNLIADNWVTDIFGNQYALYKDIKNVQAKNRGDINGEIWVRTNSQKVGPASELLANVFDTYKNTTLYSQLTGRGIKKIDVFFDTLFIQTSGVLIFETINYDYVKDNIFSLTDDARYISLASPTTLNIEREFLNNNFAPLTYAIPGDTWFLPEEKKVLIALCTYYDYSVAPEIYEYNINTKNLIKVFPVKPEDSQDMLNLFNQLLLIRVDPPLLSHNPTTKEILMAFTCQDFAGNNLILEFTLKYLSDIILQDICIYTTNAYYGLDTPPVILANLNRRLQIPNPRGRVYRIRRDILRAGTSILLEDLNTGQLLIYPVTTFNGLSTYPLSSFTWQLTSIDDTVLTLPLSDNYLFYDFNTSYVQKYGISTIIPVESLNYRPQPIANVPATFTPLNLPFWVSLTPDGLFTGTPPVSEGNYSATFKVTNSVGSTFYNLNINVA